MKINYKTIFGIALLIYGILIFLNQKLISLPSKAILGIPLILYGILSVYISMNYNKRGMLILSVIIFFTGIFLLADGFYKVYSYTSLILFLLFTLSSIFLLLFIDNIEKKIFLYVSLFLLLIIYPAIKLFQKIENSLFLYNYLKIENIILPIILILLGIYIFIKRND